MYVALSMFYGFFVRLYTAFVYVCVRLLRTLCGFFVCIWLVCFASCADFAYVYGYLCALTAFAYVYGLSFAMFDVDHLEGSDRADSLIFFICENTRDSLTVLRIRS